MPFWEVDRLLREPQGKVNILYNGLLIRRMQKINDQAFGVANLCILIESAFNGLGGNKQPVDPSLDRYLRFNLPKEQTDKTTSGDRSSVTPAMRELWKKYKSTMPNYVQAAFFANQEFMKEIQ